VDISKLVNYKLPRLCSGFFILLNDQTDLKSDSPHDLECFAARPCSVKLIAAKILTRLTGSITCRCLPKFIRIILTKKIWMYKDISCIFVL